MNISHSEIDNLESILTISITQEDLSPKVEQKLKEYRKKAQVPGFRKGMTPMSYIRKQYEPSVKYEEINQLISDSVSKYIQDNQLDLIANAIPVAKDELDLDSQEINFDFKLGFKPELNIDLSSIEVPYYNIKATEESIEEALANIKNQFSTSEAQDIIDADSNIQIDILFNDEEKPKKPLFVKLEMLKDEALLNGKKVGDVVETTSDNFLKDEERTKSIFSLDDEKTSEKFSIEVKEINKQIEPELNEELFKKVYPSEEIKTLDELKEKIKEESEKYYVESSDIYFYNQATEKLIETVDCPLPEGFLIQTIQNSGKEQLDLEKATEEFEKSKSGYKYQLIENKILDDNKIQPDYKELLDYIKSSIKKQLESYGMSTITDEQLQEFVNHTLKDQNQIARYSGELNRIKIISILKEKTNPQEKEINIDEFSEMVK
ncbi:MAG: hypothetical protein H6604_04330 [Flavobacteriales bacterium]|nr:hypothetical protein [Flavobacteriales bacterium]